MRRFVSALGIAVILPPVAVSAQPNDLPEVYQFAAPGCDAMEGIALINYQDVSGSDRRHRYVFGDVCFSPDEGVFVGPDTITDLVAVQDYGGIAVRMEVIGDGEQSHQRRRVTASALQGMMWEEPVPLDAALELAGSIPGEFVAAVPGTTFNDFSAFVYRPDRVLDALPEHRLWVAELYGIARSRLRGDDVVEIDHTAFGYGSFLLERTEEGLAYVATALGMEPGDLSLTMADGEIAGTIAMNARNPMIVDARAPDAFDTATLDTVWLDGRALDTEQGPMIVGYGLGISEFNGLNGLTEYEDAEVTFKIIPVPDYVPVEMIAQQFDLPESFQ